jgi:hypothetical protein
VQRGVGVRRRDVGRRRGSMADSNALRSRGLFYASLILFVDALAASLGISGTRRTQFFTE